MLRKGLINYILNNFSTFLFHILTFNLNPVIFVYVIKYYIFQGELPSVKHQFPTVAKFTFNII